MSATHDVRVCPREVVLRYEELPSGIWRRHHPSLASTPLNVVSVQLVRLYREFCQVQYDLTDEDEQLVSCPPPGPAFMTSLRATRTEHSALPRLRILLATLGDCASEDKVHGRNSEGVRLAPWDGLLEPTCGYSYRVCRSRCSSLHAEHASPDFGSNLHRIFSFGRSEYVFDESFESTPSLSGSHSLIILLKRLPWRLASFCLTARTRRCA